MDKKAMLLLLAFLLTSSCHPHSDTPVSTPNGSIEVWALGVDADQTQKLLDALQSQAFEVGRAVEAGCIQETQGTAWCDAAHSGWKAGFAQYDKYKGTNK